MRRSSIGSSASTSVGWGRLLRRASKKSLLEQLAEEGFFSQDALQMLAYELASPAALGAGTRRLSKATWRASPACCAARPLQVGSRRDREPVSRRDSTPRRLGSAAGIGRPGGRAPGPSRTIFARGARSGGAGARVAAPGPGVAKARGGGSAARQARARGARGGQEPAQLEPERAQLRMAHTGGDRAHGDRGAEELAEKAQGPHCPPAALAAARGAWKACGARCAETFLLGGIPMRDPSSERRRPFGPM